MSDMIVSNPDDLAKFTGATVEHAEFVSIAGIPSLAVRFEGKDGGTWEALVSPLLQTKTDAKSVVVAIALNIATRKV